MSLAITLNASAVPEPQVIGTYLYESDYNLTTSVPSLIAGNTVVQNAKLWGAKFNMNAALLDIITQCGAGVMGLVTGLVISVPGSGLSLPITAGIALIEGVVQSIASSSVTVSNGTTNYIWFKQDGTFESRTVTTAPSIPGILIGIAVASGGNITSVDGTGVVYINSGIPYRETNDSSYPTDTPPTNWIGITKTQGGLYLWTNGAYYKISDEQVVEIHTSGFSVVAADRKKIFTNTGASGNIIATLPACGVGLGPFTFIIDTAHVIEVLAQSGDTIRINSSVSSSGGNAQNFTSVGSVLTIVGVSAHEWMATAHEGTWNLA